MNRNLCGATLTIREITERFHMRGWKNLNNKLYLPGERINRRKIKAPRSERERLLDPGLISFLPTAQCMHALQKSKIFSIL
jgi:hypothetical protein